MTPTTLALAALKTQQTPASAYALPQIILMTLIKVRLPPIICGYILRIKKKTLITSSKHQIYVFVSFYKLTLNLRMLSP
jgi:hypothetical protein